MEQYEPNIMELISRAPWREAVTYRDTWPHEYVVVQRDGQQALLAAFCERIQRGEGVQGRFFHQPRQYLILGEYRYWTMTDCADMDPDGGDYVLNRAPLFKDRRDFIIREGDTASREERIDMTTQNLGRIEEVRLRDIWPHEEYDFTPWLAGNLDLLGDELGLKLELAHTEALVGSYHLDILAKETQDGSYVAIENQIEETDHDHLGKLITYAAGREAEYVIWVASSFRAEHLAAIDWLNQLAPEQVWFYGVEVRVIKIGNSDEAPEFRMVAGPKTHKTDSQRNYEFFQPLMIRLLLIGFTERDQHQASSKDYQIFPSRVGVSGGENVEYGVSIGDINGTSKASVYFYLQSGNADWDRQVFNVLQTEQQPIDAEFDGALEWDNGDTWGFSNVSIYRDGSIDSSEDELKEIREWMRENLVKFREVFNPHLEKILAELEGE